MIKTAALAALLASVTAGCAQPPDRAITLCEASASGRLKDGANLRLTSVFSTDGGVFHEQYQGTPNAFLATRLNAVERIE